MNFIGIGPLEMGIIAVVALLIFGPGKLPEVMGQAGKMVRDFRKMSAELTGEFEKTIAEAKEVGNSLTGEIGGMTKEVNSVTNSVKKDLGLKGGTATSKSKAASGEKSSTAKSASTSKAAMKSTSSSSSKKTSTSAAASGSKTTTTSAAAKPAATKKPTVPKASREDPAADISLFEPKPVERAPRSRRATPSGISDLTPRLSELEPVLPSTSPTDGGTGRSTAKSTVRSASDDALVRARERRRSAGYARTSA